MNTVTHSVDQLLTRAELATLLSISLGTINDWITEGSLTTMGKRRTGRRGQPQHVYSRATAEWLRENRRRFAAKERWMAGAVHTCHPHFGWMVLIPF